MITLIKRFLLRKQIKKKKMLMGDVIINENLKHEMQKNQA